MSYSKSKSLFTYCKEGRLSKLQVLVEESEIDLNTRDQWDSTPLYYACLCGHTDVVEYLLQKGSRCLENTFDGERCLYGALTDEIRCLVRNWKQVHQTGLKRDRHYELMTMLLDKSPFSDIKFNVHDKEFNLHKCILAARSQYFSEAFSSKWQYSNVVSIKNIKVTKKSFTAIVQYIYTGRMDIEHDHLVEVKSLARNCKLTLLLEEIQKAENRVTELTNLKPFLQKRVQVFSVESEKCTLQLHSDLRYLVDHVIPPSANNWVDYGVLPFTKDDFKIYFADVCFMVENHSFYAHRAFLCSYSEYFRARLDDHFLENSQVDEHNIPLIYLNDISVAVFKAIVMHAYADAFEISSVDSVHEVLAYSHMLMMPSLSRRCGLFLSRYINTINVFSLYKSAKTFDLLRLEHKCTVFMANNLDKIIYSEEFSKLVLEDAMSVYERQETDSVPLVDDIRHHVSEMCETLSEFEESKNKLALLDALLSRLGIDC